MTSSMVGGAKLKEAIFTWSKQSNHLFLSVLSFILIVLATFTDKVPQSILQQSSTLYGRLLLIIVLYIIFLTCGEIPAILFAVVIALLWANKPLGGSIEGFWDGVKTTFISQGANKWFIEKVLRENPLEINEDRVSTMPVQDLNTTRIGVSSHSESAMGNSTR
jgi:hypothetical protein